MIQVGYFSDFKGAPALVIAGVAADFERLADALVRSEREEVNLIETLRREGHQVHLANLSDLKISPHATRTKLSISGASAHWEITDAYATRLIGLISGLKERHSPGHQYLESGSADVQIILSKDEYSKPLV
jgi:hypothetical protein